MYITSFKNVNIKKMAKFVKLLTVEAHAVLEFGSSEESKKAA